MKGFDMNAIKKDELLRKLLAMRDDDSSMIVVIRDLLLALYAREIENIQNGIRDAALEFEKKARARESLQAEQKLRETEARKYRGESW